MHASLWILQVALAAFFLFAGINHFRLPPDLPAQMAWMYDMSPTLHAVSGALEILGSLGLVLPGALRRHGRLTPLAAGGLALVMLGAALWHVPRQEYANIPMNLVLALLLAFVAYGRFRIRPLP